MAPQNEQLVVRMINGPGKQKIFCVCFQVMKHSKLGAKHKTLLAFYIACLSQKWHYER